jgi:hypothetical protein
MWILPLLVLGAIAIATASRSGREAAPPSRQLMPPLPPPPSPIPAASSGHSSVFPPGVPGPIAVLGEILRIGKRPPPAVILCAVAEAEALGRPDLASDIVQVFVAPVVYAHALKFRPHAPLPYARGSCALPSCGPRAQAERGHYAPAASPRNTCAPHQRGTCVPAGSPRAQADQRAACAPVQAPAGVMLAAASPQPRYATPDEILGMLQTDPNAFLKVVSSGRPPVVDAPIAAPPAPPAAAAPPAVPPAPPAPAPPVVDEAALAQLLQVPGFAGAGVVADPGSGAEVFEVSWLRGFPIPPLPQQVSRWPVRVALIDDLPVQQPTPPSETAAPANLPPETVAQMQEAAGLHEAADRTRALAPGSPLPGVSDEAWRQFVMCLERESPQFASSRHVGQYRQRRERLSDLGIDPQAVHGSAAVQRAALDRDLVDAHRHAADGGILSEHLNRTIAVPGLDGMAVITLSGVLGVIQCAGLDGAVGWLERPNDRKRYPHTTQAFLRSNGAF